jgi:hypothetical protein
VLTPYVSGSMVAYWERAVDVFEVNLARRRTGEEVRYHVDGKRKLCVRARSVARRQELSDKKVIEFGSNGTCVRRNLSGPGSLHRSPVLSRSR